MRSRRIHASCVLTLWLLGFSAGSAGVLAATIAVFPIQNQAGDSTAAAAVDEQLRVALGRRGEIIDPVSTRTVLRRLRVRNGDQASPELIGRLGEELGAEWAVSVTLHDADRRLVPRLTVSMRIYSADTGRVTWSVFEGASGLDRRKLLGLGTVDELERLAPVVIGKLLRALPEDLRVPGDGQPRTARRSGSQIGTVALFPLGAFTDHRASAHAETVTEAARAQLYREGVDLASPNRIFEILRRLQNNEWGSISAETRVALRNGCGVDAVLTGSVERYNVTGAESEPEPQVTVAMRLIDAATGRILWTGSAEREGWDRGGLFRLGRIYSRGVLTKRIMERLMGRLARAELPTGSRLEESG